MADIKILGFSGSLRKGSMNTALLRMAGELLPDGAKLDIAEIGDLPLYNEDLRINGGFPDPAARLRAQAQAADALLMATPEYNLSIPPALKNAIDWVSRPPTEIFSGKPVGIFGASGNALGTVRAQLHLRQILLGVDADVVRRPQVLIGGAREKFDAEMKFNDAMGRDLIRQLLEKLVASVRERKR
jgi:chromate reductase